MENSRNSFSVGNLTVWRNCRRSMSCGTISIGHPIVASFMIRGNEFQQFFGGIISTEMRRMLFTADSLAWLRVEWWPLCANRIEMHPILMSGTWSLDGSLSNCLHHLVVAHITELIKKKRRDRVMVRQRSAESRSSPTPGVLICVTCIRPRTHLLASLSPWLHPRSLHAFNNWSHVPSSKGSLHGNFLIIWWRVIWGVKVSTALVSPPQKKMRQIHPSLERVSFLKERMK